MKYLLISLNILLVAALGYLAWSYVYRPIDFSSETQAVQHAGAHQNVDRKKASAKASASQAAAQVSPEVMEQKIAEMLTRNIFNTERVPDAPANKSNRNSQQQIRAEMSLVGTYTIGDSLGAIILQRIQGNSQQQLKALQQKEYEQYQASATRVTDPKKKNAEGGNSDGKAGADDEPAVIVAGNTTVSANNVFRQHLKVGDTTVNGYKLVEVTRTSAVLTKNSERIELSLLPPSEAGNIARQRQNQQNNNNNRNNNNNDRNNNNNNNNNRNNQQANRNNNNNNNNRNNQQANRNNNNNNNRNNNNRNNNRNNNNYRNNNRNNDDIEWF